MLSIRIRPAYVKAITSSTTFLVLALGGLFLLAYYADADTTNTVAEPTKPCFQCSGTGMMKCPVRSCVHGMADCPGPCIKLSKGTWVHMHVDGHPDSDIWQKFYTAGGGYQAWNQNHVGDVIQMQGGVPTDIGKCTVCGGTGKTKCAVCKGTGEVMCAICGGTKVVPVSWTAFDNPKMKDRPSKFTLKDGKIVIGRSVMIGGTETTIRAEKGDVRVATTDILSEEKQTSQK